PGATCATGCASTSSCASPRTSSSVPTTRSSMPRAFSRSSSKCGPRARERRALVSNTVRVPADVVAALDRAPGRALMLGHVHPDADVLGRLLAIGEALQTRGWSVAAGGPHPAPGALGFLPGVERYQVLKSLEGAFDVAVLTDCPNPGRTEGLIDQAKTAASVVVNIDHHPDNRRYGHVNWIDTTAAATGEMVYRLLVGLEAACTAPYASNHITS